jgi:hypothetical protein
MDIEGLRGELNILMLRDEEIGEERKRTVIELMGDELKPYRFPEIEAYVDFMAPFENPPTSLRSFLIKVRFILRFVIREPVRLQKSSVSHIRKVLDEGDVLSRIWNRVCRKLSSDHG